MISRYRFWIKRFLPALSILFCGFLCAMASQAADSDEISRFLIFIDTGSAMKPGVIVEEGGTSYVLTSQPALYAVKGFTLETFNGDELTPSSLEVPDTGSPLLRIGIKEKVPGIQQYEDGRIRNAYIYSVDPVHGTVNPEQGRFRKDSLSFKAPYSPSFDGSPVITENCELLAVAAMRGLPPGIASWVRDGIKTFPEKGIEAHPVSGITWKEVSWNRFSEASEVYMESTRFTVVFRKTLQKWMENPARVMENSHDHPMRKWIELANETAYQVPVTIQEFKDSIGKNSKSGMKKSKRNVSAFKLKRVLTGLYKRLYMSLSSESKKTGGYVGHSGADFLDNELAMLCRLQERAYDVLFERKEVLMNTDNIFKYKATKNFSKEKESRTKGMNVPFVKPESDEDNNGKKE